MTQCTRTDRICQTGSVRAGLVVVPDESCSGGSAMAVFVVSTGEVVDIIGLPDRGRQLPLCHALCEPREVCGAVAGGDAEDSVATACRGRNGLDPAVCAGENDTASGSRCAEPVLSSAGCDDDGVVSAGCLDSIHRDRGVVEDPARPEMATEVLTRGACHRVDVGVEETSELNRGRADGSRRAAARAAPAKHRRRGSAARRRHGRLEGSSARSARQGSMRRYQLLARSHRGRDLCDWNQPEDTRRRFLDVERVRDRAPTTPIVRAGPRRFGYRG